MYKAVAMGVLALSLVGVAAIIKHNKNKENKPEEKELINPCSGCPNAGTEACTCCCEAEEGEFEDAIEDTEEAVDNEDVTDKATDSEFGDFTAKDVKAFKDKMKVLDDFMNELSDKVNTSSEKLSSEGRKELGDKIKYLTNKFNDLSEKLGSKDGKDLEDKIKDFDNFMNDLTDKFSDLSEKLGSKAKDAAEKLDTITEYIKKDSEVIKAILKVKPEDSFEDDFDEDDYIEDDDEWDEDVDEWDEDEEGYEDSDEEYPYDECCEEEYEVPDTDDEFYDESEVVTDEQEYGADTDVDNGTDDFFNPADVDEENKTYEESDEDAGDFEV